ncbi:protein MEI2-like 4 isoform X2 [Phragmites australis]|nr:protein MEI2-like 4 isoform X2 [Phragmites australis]
MQPHKLMDQKTPFGLEDKLLGQKNVNLPRSSCRADQDHVHRPHSFFKPLASPLEGRRENSNMSQFESGLFSSSLPDIFDKKIRLTPKDGIVGQLVEKVHFNNVDDEPFELTKEVEAQIIGNLLPDDDDLLSGVLDDVGYTARANNQDDIDDDIFYTGGGMELEADENSKSSEVNGGANNSQTRLNGQLNEGTYGELPSRILFVRNIDSDVEDSELKFLFEQYGDIHTFNASCKHHGFMMVSYYDVRSAENAMKALQSKPLRRRKLDIHYSTPEGYPSEKDINRGTLVFNLDPSVTNDDLHRIFGVYGEIKEIHNTSDNGHHKLMEFYDVRAAEAARYALNRSNIAGKQIKLEPSCQGGTKRLMQQMSRELEQGRFGVCKLGSPCSPSSTCFGSVNVTTIRSTGPESGTVQVLRSRVQTPTNQFREGKSFLDLPSTTIPSVSSPVGIATAGSQSNHYALDEHSHSLEKMNGQNNGQMDYGFQEISAFHAHSLPEFNNRQSNAIPYNLSTIPPIGVRSNIRTAEAMDDRHIYKGGSGNLSHHSSAQSEALGFSRTGSWGLHGHQLVQSNSNNLHHQPSSPMLWPSTGPFFNNIPSRPSMQIHGISRAPSHMLENTIPMNHQHVGSAPAVNPSIWDRPHGHSGKMIEASGFHTGSAGSMGFPGSPHLHQLEPNSMFPHTGETFTDSAMSPTHMGAPSPQQRWHMFHRRSHMAPFPSSFDSSGERMRSRRNESSANQSDNKRLYELDIERIVRGKDSRTTLMIKNIPNKYTSKMLLAVIDENHRGTYDFIYLPIDFKNKCNVGYAFINMINPEHIVPFYKSFNGKRWEKFNSEKVASLAYARIQGKSALIAHFQNSSLMNEDKRCRPILFHSDGPNAGDQEPFPVGMNVRSRPGRSRILSYEENHQDVLSAPAKGESPVNRCGDAPGYITRETDPTSAA